MSIAFPHATALFIQPFADGIETHWETVTHLVWNEQEHTNEEQELVYEVSWIAELATWRRFLRSQRRVKS